LVSREFLFILPCGAAARNIKREREIEREREIKERERERE
jgi:hypothetical protein